MANLDIESTTITYDDAGHGAPPMLFVHGWGGNRSHFAPQMAHFSASHRVVALDRRGHGQSEVPAGDANYSIERQADDLAAVMVQLGLDRAVVVQHSFDRLTYDLATRYPELVLAVAILDGPTLAGPQFDEAARGFLAGLESDQWQAAIRGFAEHMVFPAGTPADVIDATLAEVYATGQPVLAATWRSFIEYPLEPALAALHCPLLYVAGCFPSDLDRLRELCPQLEVAEVRGCGHFIQLAAADDVNRILAGFVERITAGAAPSPAP